MKVALVGYGRMGHEIESILTARGHQISRRIDPAAGGADATTADTEVLKGTDVAIEFSLPDAVERNAAAYAGAGCSAIVGTTGWEDRRATIKQIVEESGIGYLAGSNFSIGAHLFFRLTAAFAEALDSFDEYDISVHETHHNLKKDSPSGTALTTAEIIVEHLGRKRRIYTEAPHRQVEADELHVSSTRIGSVPGTHTVLADSAADSIELTHRARSRAGFALGAVRAAEWLADRTGFLDVRDFIDDVLRR